jgi:hypothetical protein
VASEPGRSDRPARLAPKVPCNLFRPSVSDVCVREPLG